MGSIDKIIKKFEMVPHPEGGYYKEFYRDQNISLIYYLLKKNEESHWHRLMNNEILHFYDGDPLEIYLSENGITIKKIILGKNENQFFHFVVNNGTWFSMKSKGEYSLIGCSVAPPFNYADFEMAPKDWKPGKL